MNDKNTSRSGKEQIEAPGKSFADAEQRFQVAFNGAADAIFWSDTTDGMIINCNKAAEDLLERPKEELIGKHHTICYSPEKRDEYDKLFQSAAKEKKTVNTEIEIMTKTGSKPIHIISSVIDLGGKAIVQGIFRDISEHKQAEAELVYRMDFEKLIGDISARFINLAPNELDHGIDEALRKIGEFMQVDRAYIFQFSSNMITMDNTHEWAADGIEPKIMELKNLDIAVFSWSVSRINRKEIVNIPCVEDLPPEAGPEKDEFRSEEIQSLVMVPLVCERSVLGFLAFDSVWKERTWNDDVISLMKIVGEIFASALERRKVEEELRYRIEFDELITSIAASFINLPTGSISKAANNALRDLGEFMGVDRCSLFEISETEKVVERTHFWSAEGADLTDHPRIKYKGMPWGLDAILRMETLKISNVKELPAKAIEVNEYMTSQGIKSLICVPFTYNDKNIGVLSLAMERQEQKWHDDTIALLKIIAEIFAGAIGRKSATLHLERQRALINALMDNSPDAVYFKDKESRFIKISKAQAKKFGLNDPREAEGKTDYDFFLKEHADKTLADEREIIKSGRPVIGQEEKETWLDGSETWVSTTKAPLFDENGEISGTFGISRDITAMKNADKERRKLEARMQHTQKLERLGILSGGIAHDFNNLLMGILGNSGLALMELSPESPAWNNVKQIEAVALQAAELTNQMLAYSGKSKFVVKPLNLVTLVKEIGHLIAVSISKRVKLVYNFSDSIHLINGDPAQVRQVVMNLITNASDAIGNRKGTVTVNVDVMKCDNSYLLDCIVGENQPPGRYVFVEVSDTGSGMDMETQEKIFDPFFTTKVKGRGLGLAAALGIVRGHKGALRVYSEVGRGTTFKVLFPCSREEIKETDRGEAEQSQWHGSGTVMIVDDDEIIRTVTGQMLIAAGFSVTAVKNGNDAIKQFKKDSKKIVAILLDMAMPEMTGEEVLEKLRRISKDTPIIVISGYDEGSATNKIKPDSYESFLQKPFSTDALIDKLREVLEEKED